MVSMVKRDAIAAIDDLVARLKDVNATRDELLGELHAEVRRAYQQGYPKTKLAQRTGVHPNTITAWCNEQ